jgi:hypothetical protein
LPTAVYASRGVFAPNTNTFYVFGGHTGEAAVANVQRFSVATNTWSAGTPMPAARTLSNVVYDPASGKIIVQGGFDSALVESGQTWVYDPVANSWNTTRASSPIPLAGSGAGIIGQYMYVMGSYNNGVPSNANYRYDHINNTWIPLEPVPTGMYVPAAGIFNNKVYLSGGGDPARPRDPWAAARSGEPLRSGESPDTSFTATHIYDPGTNTWSAGPNTNVPHSFTAGTVIGNHMYVVGGSTGPVDTNIVERLGLGCPTYISGRVTYENTAADRPVAFTNLNGTGSSPVSIFTNLSGNYMLTGFGAGAYTVTPSRAAMTPAASNGIFSNDAALISRHVVGLTTLNPVQIRAAMVAGQPTLTTFDAGLVARWIVGLTTANNQTGTWKFSPANRSYHSVTTDQLDQNYLALLMGDVSGDWAAAPMRPAAVNNFDAVLASVPREMKSGAGTQVTVPLRLDNLGVREVSSYQFDIEYDPSVISPSKIAAKLENTLAEGMTVYSNVIKPGLLKVAVFAPMPVYGDGAYIDLKFNLIGRSGTSTPVNIVGFRFNDGLDPVITANGVLTVTSP